MKVISHINAWDYKLENQTLNIVQEELPDHIRLRLKNLIFQEDYLKVAEFCKNITQKYPNSLIAWNNLGSAYRMIHKYAEASEAFRQTISLNPTFPDGHANLGATFQDISAFNIAIECYKTALELDPNNAKAHNNMGTALKSQGKYEGALIHFFQAITLEHDFIDAHCNLADVYRCLGLLEKAIDSYSAALSIQPDNAVAQHMLSALKGQTTHSPPMKFVEQLFDRYAPTFEYELVEKLNYSLPENLANLIVNRACGGAINSVLDMGCGTGLFGSKIRNYCQNLYGIDISKQMLRVAEHKDIYDKLTQTDIINFLRDSETNFEYLVAADVFIYVGELSEIFRLLNSRRRGHGTFIFSTEHNEKYESHLEKSGRYSHSKSYIERLCRDYNYSLSHFEIIRLRKEKNSFITGGIYILEF